MITLQDKLGWYLKDDSTVVYEKWDEIKEVLKEAPTADEFIKMLSAVGLDFDEFKALYGDKKIKNAVRYAKDLKDRYTVLWLDFVYFG